MMTKLHDAAQAMVFETRAFIGGRFKHSHSGKTFVTINPATGKLIAHISETDQTDVDEAVTIARQTFESGIWSKMAPKERKKILLRLADLVEKHAEELALIESLDNGKPYADALAADLPDAVETIRWHAETIDKIYDQVSPTSANIVSMIVREPIGVVGAVVPWNFPLPITAMKLAPALAAGNSLIIKPAELTTLSALRFAALTVEAGIPLGVLSVLPGFGITTGQAIGRHPDIDCLTFTGSTAVGRLFLKYSAETNLKKVTLELGGKSPVIVMDDVSDLQPIVDHIAIGILFSQGENCSAGSRLLVHKKIKARLMAAILDTFSKWKVGDPLDPETKIGAMVEEKHLNRVMAYIDSGKKAGAKLLMGGEKILSETGGYFVGPTVFDHVTNDMVIAQEEIFGPVLSVIEFSDEAEAIKIANDTVYGLAASVHTNDLSVAHRMARGIRAGTVSVNCFSEGDNAVPFGGFKLSGFGGREKSLHAHDQYTELKTIWIQLKP
jgi:4-(gamma-glutamylamino)butanal dehydrogenase